jgi:hypothetical protein
MSIYCTSSGGTAKERAVARITIARRLADEVLAEAKGNQCIAEWPGTVRIAQAIIDGIEAAKEFDAGRKAGIEEAAQKAHDMLHVWPKTAAETCAEIRRLAEEG